MKLEKTSRFSKISGDFGEALFLYWLSKHGCETARIDYTGIDLLAFHKRSKTRLGISIKTRTRVEGSELRGVHLRVHEIQKIKGACGYFSAEPYVGVVVDAHAGGSIDCLLIHLNDLVEINPAGKSVLSIGVSAKHWEKYNALKKGLRIHLTYKVDGKLPELADLPKEL
jgi:hypothetical protein